MVMVMVCFRAGGGFSRLDPALRRLRTADTGEDRRALSGQCF